MLSQFQDATDTMGATGFTPINNTENQQVLQLQAQVHQLTERLSQLSLQAPNQVLLSSYPSPEKYAGDPKWRRFLLQCKHSNTHAGMDEMTKPTQFMNFLNKRTLSWATAVWLGENDITNYEQLSTVLISTHI